MKKISLFFVLFLCFWSLKAQDTTIIKGEAKTYAGKTLKLYRYTDYITFGKEEVSRTTVDSAGNFSFVFPLKHTERLFADLDGYLGIIYCSPNKEYEVLLPVYKAKDKRKSLNPYYTPPRTRLIVINDTNALSNRIAFFDNLLSENLRIITKNRLNKKDTVENTILSIEKIFEADSNEFFKTYREYRYAMLRRITYFKNTKLFVKKYFYTGEPQVNNPAYMNLFSSTFEGCFDPRISFFKVSSLLAGLKETNFDQIVDSLQKVEEVENRDAAALIAIKGLSDLYYQYEPVGEDIITTLEKAEIKNPQIQKIANNVYHDLIQIRKGYPAPYFKLRSKGNKYYTPESFKGKFVYLNFCHPLSHACRQQLPMLRRYYEMQPKGLEIVTVLYGVDRDEFKQFLKEHKEYKWLFLYGGDMPDLLQKYKVASFPSYYLINPDGLLELSPAPTPEENFEQQYNQAYRNWLRKINEQKNTGIRTH